jgi:hypothetical protein
VQNSACVSRSCASTASAAWTIRARSDAIIGCASVLATARQSAAISASSSGIFGCSGTSQYLLCYIRPLRQVRDGTSDNGAQLRNLSVAPRDDYANV